MKNHNGFSLIELLIVVVIIGIIAAVAIPNLLAARVAANEASAIASLRTYHSAQLVYQATVGEGFYAGDPASGGLVVPGGTFPTLARQQLIDSALGDQNKSGYWFQGHAKRTAGGVPVHLGRAQAWISTPLLRTGTRNFTIATEGVIYFIRLNTAVFDEQDNYIQLGQPLGGK